MSVDKDDFVNGDAPAPTVEPAEIIYKIYDGCSYNGIPYKREYDSDGACFCANWCASEAGKFLSPGSVSTGRFLQNAAHGR